MKYEKGSFILVPNKEVLRGKGSAVQLVFFWLCDYADKKGVCFPSRKTLSKDSSLSLPTIDRSIKELCILGLITKTKRFSENEQLSNLYQINIK